MAGLYGRHIQRHSAALPGTVRGLREHPEPWTPRIVMRK